MIYLNSSEIINKYYSLINKLLSEYVEKWNISPSRLKKYFKPGGKKIKNFIKRNNLENVKNIEKIILDVIEDFYGMEKDKILNKKIFESTSLSNKDFYFYEKISFDNNEKTILNKKKILADYFDTSLGQIKTIDKEKNIFKLNNWDKDKIIVVIHSFEDIKKIKNALIEYLYNKITNRDITLFYDIIIKLHEITNFNEFKEKINILLSKKEKIFLKILSNMIGGKFKVNYNGYYIWLLK